MKEMTEIQKNQLVAQYEPLVNKLVAQFHKSVQCSWEDLHSYAYEGLAMAINKYDESRSNMTFTQYAAFEIRNNILNCLNNELRTVKLSAYAQKVVVEQGGSLFNTVSIDRPTIIDGEEDLKPRETVMGMYENEKFSNGDPLSYLIQRLHERFSATDCEIFCKIFGLNGFDVTPNQQVAAEYSISAGRVSQKIKAMTTWCRSDKDICEVLSELL